MSHLPPHDRDLAWGRRHEESQPSAKRTERSPRQEGGTVRKLMAYALGGLSSGNGNEGPDPDSHHGVSQ